MRFSTLIFALAGAVAAETVNMFIPYYDEQPFVAKSIGSDGDVTTYVLGCAAGTDSNDCGLSVPRVVTQGSKTMHYYVNYIVGDGSPEYSL